ncbi:ExbD/TolR family protein [Jiella sonneratiae]|uniref:Biopolymer transporter ExbD n=1 Tax=Jiella sonneratiae TaxID=2816856 RepID=A0ABS3J479_9HYPH|nr:biopolymer transporter ExbD [Jiella sonneratiae]MBO0904489.1 biopolymer transporter ExbD [Jiella sonneratiae]
MRAPRQRAVRRFVLTPLVDVIFLLVIFFALSSRIAPFGLIPVTGHGVAAGDRPSGVAAPAPAAGPEPEATLVLSRGSVRIDARRLPLGDLAAEAARLEAEGIETVLVVTARSASAEDVAAALDALRGAGIAAVRLIAGPGGGADPS